MQYIAHALKKLQHSWRSEFHNLSQIESLVLLTIASRPGIKSAEIQEELNLDQPHASRIFKKLISKRVIRSLSSTRADRKKAYFLTPQKGASTFLSWIDKVLDELLILNPAMLGRFIAALEDAPEDVVDCLEKGILRVKQQRAINSRKLGSKNGYNLARRNQSDHSYRKFFV